MAIILIADDQAPTRHLLRFMLSKENHIVITARDGQDAIHKLADEQVDIILTDVNMPRMNGWEFLTHLRKSAQYGSLPVIVFSAGTPCGFTNKAKQYGATRSIAQPFSTREIMQVIDECLNA